MKKKLMSLLMAMVLILGVASPSFAAGMPGGEEVEPFNNRYYYTYETKPTGKTSTVTISKTEAFVKDTIKSIMAKGVAEVVEAVVPGNQEMKEKASGIAEDFTNYIYSKEPYARAGTYTITTAKKYKYRVDRLDESKRYIETTWLVTSCEFVGFDNTTDSYSRQVVMK